MDKHKSILIVDVNGESHIKEDDRQLLLTANKSTNSPKACNKRCTIALAAALAFALVCLTIGLCVYYHSDTKEQQLEQKQVRHETPTSTKSKSLTSVPKEVKITEAMIDTTEAMIDTTEAMIDTTEVMIDTTEANMLQCGIALKDPGLQTDANKDSGSTYSLNMVTDKLKRFKRVVHGTIADIRSFPWMASIQRSGYFNSYSWDHFCGGAIIDKYWILSAAHCYEGSGKQRVMVGNEQRMKGDPYEIAAFIQNPNYEPYASDSSLIRLRTPIEFNNRTAPICLARPDHTVNSFTECYVAGWGFTAFHAYGGGGSHDLRQSERAILPISRCKEELDLSDYNIEPINEHDHICVGEKDTSNKPSCHGDSGGPLSCRDRSGKWFVYGIVSFGNTDCRGLSVYTRVTSSLPWIQQTIESYSDGV